MAPTDQLRLRILMEPRHGATYSQILALARTTADAGFDAFFRSDHLFGVDPNDPTYRPAKATSSANNRSTRGPPSCRHLTGLPLTRPDSRRDRTTG